MQAVTIEEAQRDLERLLTQVLDDAAPTSVVLASGQQVVLVPLDEYAAWQETRYLLTSPANAAHLQRSMAELANGDVEEKKLLDA